MEEKLECEEIEEDEEFYYTNEELGIDESFNYYDDNKDVFYYGER